jgi:very-short-patch-repair endonuclease
VDWSSLKADYERLGTFKAVAEEYGVSAGWIGFNARRLGIVSPRAHPTSGSPLEKLLQGALREAGIGFTTQVRIDRYTVDVLINQAPIVIEADGFWHLIHSDHDAKRDKVLAEAGYQVFRFDGAALNDDAFACVQHVIGTCNLMPDEKSVYTIQRMGLGPRTLTCTACGSDFTEPKQRNSRGWSKTFCNSKCYGTWLREHPEHSNRRYDIDWSDLGRLYAEGATMRELANRYGVAPNTICRNMRRLGIQPRASGRRKKS